MAHPPVILHADMDAFYAAIEQRDRPELRGKPVIVGGGGPRGVVSTASYEARKFGVHSAMPGYEARRRCPQGIFVSGDMKRYARESKRIFEVFRRFTPSVEGISLDEAFLDMTGSERLMGSPREVAERLRSAVRSETGLAVSVGIAPVKMVAKIASDLAKPDGVLEVARDGVRAFLDPLPVGRIWGVGPVARARLEQLGFRTIGDLARAESRTLERTLGDWGVAIGRLARGRDARDVTPFRDAVSYSEENTFDRDVAEMARLDAAILAHGDAVARRLRREGVRARTVVLKLKLARRVAPGPRGYPLLTRRTTLTEATDDGGEIAAAARALLRVWGLPEPVRLLGVGVTNVIGDAGQLPLFAASPKRARRSRLNRALDQIEERFGARAVRRAGGREERKQALSDQIKRGDDPSGPDQS